MNPLVNLKRLLKFLLFSMIFKTIAYLAYRAILLISEILMSQFLNEVVSYTRTSALFQGYKE